VNLCFDDFFLSTVFAHTPSCYESLSAHNVFNSTLPGLAGLAKKHHVNPFPPVGAYRATYRFFSVYNARRFYSSIGNPLGVKGLNSLPGTLGSHIISSTHAFPFPFPFPGHFRKICQLSHTLCRLPFCTWFLRQPLFTDSSKQLKKGVFTNKIKFHLHNLSTMPWRLFHNMTGDNEPSIVTIVLNRKVFSKRISFWGNCRKYILANRINVMNCTLKMQDATTESDLGSNWWLSSWPSRGLSSFFLKFDLKAGVEAKSFSFESRSRVCLQLRSEGQTNLLIDVYMLHQLHQRS